MGRIGTGLALLALTGCGSGADPSPVPPAERDFAEVDRVALMEKHYNSAIAAHDAVIRADLAGFRSRIAELVEQPLPANAPTGWKPLHRQMEQAATAAAEVEDNDQAAAAIGAVIGTCGACHTAMPTGPVYQKPEAPKGETELATKMLRHQWATERLWEGVTGPRPDAWTRGADALAKTEVFAEDSGAPKALRAREAALRAVGVEAGTAAPEDRPAIYGKLLGTCAACHVEAGVDLTEK